MRGQPGHHDLAIDIHAQRRRTCQPGSGLDLWRPELRRNQHRTGHIPPDLRLGPVRPADARVDGLDNHRRRELAALDVGLRLRLAANVAGETQEPFGFPRGSGCEFAREFRLPTPRETLVDLVAQGEVRVYHALTLGVAAGALRRLTADHGI